MTVPQFWCTYARIDDDLIGTTCSVSTQQWVGHWSGESNPGGFAELANMLSSWCRTREDELVLNWPTVTDNTSVSLRFFSRSLKGDISCEVEIRVGAEDWYFTDARLMRVIIPTEMAQIDRFIEDLAGIGRCDNENAVLKGVL